MQTLTFIFILYVNATTPPAPPARNPTDEASERTPPAVVTGVTCESGRQVGLYDFYIYVRGKIRGKGKR